MDYALYQKISKVTLGKQPADLVLKNLKLVDVFTGEIVESNVAVKDGLIAGVSRRYRGKKEIDLGGKYLAPVRPGLTIFLIRRKNLRRTSTS